MDAVPLPFPGKYEVKTFVVPTTRIYEIGFSII